MTFKQLLKNNTWPTISSRFLEIYPEAEENMQGYKNVLDTLKLMEIETMDMSIVITKECDGDGANIDVSGLYNHPKEEAERYLQGLEFIPWRQWLGMGVSKESLNNFSELEIIVHCLYEMTFEGFSEKEIREKMDRIQKGLKKRESMTKEEQAAIKASVEELLASQYDDGDDYTDS